MIQDNVMPLVRFRVREKEPVIEEVSLSQSKLDDARLRECVIWPFYKKVLKHRLYNPLYCLVETFKHNGKLRARVRYVFERKSNNSILTIYVSRHEPLYFIVAQGAKIFQSAACLNYTEFDEVFRSYFKRKKPILSLKPGY